MGGRWLYFGEKAWQAVRHAPGVSALTAATICAALSVVGLYAMLLQNLEGLTLVWGRAGNISCYLADTVAPAQYEKVRRDLAQLGGVDRALLVTPHEALQRFRARGGDAVALVEGVPDDALAAAVEIYLPGGFSDLRVVGELARRAASVPGVAAVDFGEGEFAALNALLRLLRGGGLLFGAFVAAAAAFMVANTIRLVVYAQREEIGILRLVGATGTFICVPYVLEGAFWGLCGGTCGALALWLLDRYAAPRLTLAAAPITGGLDVRLFSAQVAIGLLAAGVSLGVVGSALAVRRFLTGAFDESGA